MNNPEIDSIYEAYKKLSHAQRRQLIVRLQGRGVGITDIEAYTYPGVDGIKHLFFYWKDRKEPVPYFLLSPEVWGLVKSLLNP